MKRNLLLLTAVVLATVLLAGCTLPIIGNAVKIKVVDAKNDEGKVLIKATDLAKEYKKESAFVITFEYTEDYVDEEIVFSWTPEDTEIVKTVLKPTEANEEEEVEAFRGGFKLEGVTAKKNITITTKVKPVEEAPAK